MMAKHTLGEIKANHCRAVREQAITSLQNEMAEPAGAERGTKMNGWILFRDRHREEKQPLFGESSGEFQSRMVTEAQEIWQNTDDSEKQRFTVEAREINAAAKWSRQLALLGDSVQAQSGAVESVVAIKIASGLIAKDVHIDSANTPWGLGSGHWPVSQDSLKTLQGDARARDMNLVKVKAEQWCKECVLPIEEDDEVINKHYTERVLCQDLFGGDNCRAHSDEGLLRRLWGCSEWFLSKARSLTDAQVQGFPVLHVDAELDDSTHSHFFFLVLGVGYDKGEHVDCVSYQMRDFSPSSPLPLEPFEVQLELVTLKESPNCSPMFVTEVPASMLQDRQTDRQTDRLCLHFEFPSRSEH